MNYKLSQELIGHSQDVKAVSFIDRNTLISGSRDNTAIVWKRGEDSDWSATATISTHDNYVNSVGWLAAADLVATGSQDSLVNLHKYKHNTTSNHISVPAYTLLGHSANVCSIDTSATGLVATGSWDTTARIWNQGVQVACLAAHSQAVWSVKFTPDNKHVITASADKSIVIWDLDSAKPVHFIQNAHDDAVRSLTILNHAIGFASASNDLQIKLWTFDGENIMSMHGHTEFIYALATLPSGGIVSAGEDRSVKVWQDGECVQTIIHPSTSVWSVAAAENGDIASASSDGIVRVWSVDPARIAHQDALKTYDNLVAGSTISSRSSNGINANDVKSPESLQQPGQRDGHVMLVKDAQTVSAHSWSAGEQTWKKIGEVVDAAGGVDPSNRVKHTDGKDYDYVFDVDIEDGKPPLKLPYNVSENPYIAAQRFLEKNLLPLTYLDETVKFIESNTSGVQLGQGSAEYVDPYTGTSRYQSNPAPPPSSTNLQDPYTGSNAGASASTSNNSPLPIKGPYLTFIQANVPAMLDKLRQLNGGAKHPLDNTQLGSIERLGKYVMESNPAAEVDVFDLSVLLHALRTWPKSDIFPLLDLLRALASRSGLVASSNDVTAALLDAAEFVQQTSSTDESNIKSLQTRQMLSLRALANTFGNEAGRKTRGVTADELLKYLDGIPFGTLNKLAKIALSSLLFKSAVAQSSVLGGGDSGGGEMNSPSELARKISAAVLPKIDKPNVKRVLVVGSGGLSIGQAGEFDYSGSQAIKALRESGIEVLLVNPNIATIQTSHELAHQIYFLPVTPDYVAAILEKERPDGIFLTFGGQSALNVGVALDKMGLFERLGVQVLGTPIRTLEVSEDRDLFVQALNEIDIPAAQSTAVGTVPAALDAAQKIGYPVILRSAFSLGGLGSGFANNEDELRDLSAKSLSLSPQVLIEKSLKGWKEVEYEVVRDAADNVIICCNMENFDPLGVHTGDSIVVAPSQTLTDAEYHMLRSAAAKIVRHVGVVGECNVQYALDPHSKQYMVIEMNARLSRSSALASKATGYPLAYTAAKIGLGHTLPELPNAVTKTTTACFEPSLDYIVTKIPKWDLAKFQHVQRDTGSSMKSVGEVMAIGRTFEESLQKAVRQVDPNYHGFEAYWQPEDLDAQLIQPNDRRLFAIAHAMINKGYTVEMLHNLTKIDRWYLYKLDNIVQIHKHLSSLSGLDAVNRELLYQSKRAGFADTQIASLTKSTEGDVRKTRKDLGITPFVKRIDTLAAEFPAHTNYLYTTYNAQSHDLEFNDNGTMVLGSGVYRIGSSVEFDWCAVTCARAVRGMDKKTIMINYNPETVSTDFDEADRLYFEELGWERVMDIYELEKAEGVIISVGGQLPQNIALRLKQSGVNVLGTAPEDIDMAEDRHKFSSVLDSINVDQPAWVEAATLNDAKAFASKVGYPVLIRPSYVLSGAAMNVVYDETTLEHNLSAAANVSPDHPVVVSQFIDSAQEIDVDAVAHKGELLVHAVSEHVENAGVHSGDATLALPPFSLPETEMPRYKEIAQKVAKAFRISGPFNMQVIRKAGENGSQPELKVIECNLRASRSFPFVSKVLGTNFIDIATAAIVGKNVPAPVDLMAEKRDYVAIKVPQFSWTRLAGADPYLGVEMASTGEVASFGKDIHEAYWASLASTNGFRIPKAGKGVLVGGDIAKPELKSVSEKLTKLGFKMYCSNADVETHLNQSGLSPTKRIFFPTKDKRKLREVFDDHEIQFVVNLSKSRGKDTVDEDYVARRNCVDFGLPLFNNAKLAELFVDALEKKMPVGGLEGYREGKIPSEVKSWKEFVPEERKN
ncbi:hypothetical protein E3P77_02783 [Wallemia ichthyophaga]|uniref:Ammonium-dependent carbamoyl phosphate synthetase n=1 Tax=Wallemia ichthyophaga TaxID=245174 RepID=A0A4T0H2G5_WALIC|nr:hypothetical protein E3P93_03320 [Wallemia ichthyophaga]TIB09336.1 hypothetical protein E3P90_03319 [Wallemia ichthyophaga]TIB20235.1 hypothetical protein E3P89_03337 [Wallemia ichthyophaga]TIB21825.1 hypothetical protein E3P88_03332 [Wallemia ichthyophaga]TIB65304.1 hypothetical protein E3P77_02783 [Wallemia ichthyophaga]